MSEYRFELLLDGIRVANFNEMSGMSNQVDAITYREGGASSTSVLPLPTPSQTVQLKYGLTQSKDLFTWIQSSVMGNLERKNISIVLINEDNTENTRWNLSNAWITKYNFSDMDGQSDEMAIESLTVMCEILTRT